MILPVVLLVLQRSLRRASVKARVIFALNVGAWIARCAARLTASRLPIVSFSVSSSLWCRIFPAGSGPFFDSQTTTARSRHVLGSATLTHARLVPPLLCRVLIVTVPTGYRFDAGIPDMNWPLAFLIIISIIYSHGNC